MVMGTFLRSLVNFWGKGHLDLSRKLDNAISIASSVDNKMGIHTLYINKHGSDINKLILQIAHGKQKIS